MALQSIFELFSPKTKTTFQEVTIIVDSEGKAGTQTKDLISLDATISMNLKGEAESTDHAIEEGAEFSDNINVKPLIYDIKGKIVNNPITLGGIVSSLGSASVGLLGGVSTKSALAQYGSSKLTGFLLNEGSGNRLKRAIESLFALQKTKKLFTVVSKLKSLDNVHIQTLNIDADNKSGDSFNFSGTLKQLTIIQSDVAVKSILNVDPSVAPGAEKQDLGSKKGIEKESTFFDSLKKKSVLKTIFG